MGLIKPDLKSVAWLLAGFLVLPRVVAVVRSKMNV